MSPVPLLIDTWAAIWIVRDELSDDAEALIEDSGRRKAVFVSPITAWELGMLASKGRIRLHRDAPTLFSELLKGGVQLAPMDPDILIASSFLPESCLRDPADRVIAATARALGWRVVTRDRPLLDYAEAGWMQAVAC